MKGKLRIALAISLLFAFVSSIAAEAAPATAAAPSVTVTAWSACTQADGSTKLDATGIFVSGVRKYTKDLVVEPVYEGARPGIVPATWTSSKKSGLTATWTSSAAAGDPMYLTSGATYSARVYIRYNDGFSSVQSPQFTFVAGDAGCTTMP